VLVDDYAEIWVNGQIPRRLGRPSPATIQGFNMPNRVVLTESVKAGDTFQVAVFGINGPISLAPPNTVWFRRRWNSSADRARAAAGDAGDRRSQQPPVGRPAADRRRVPAV
jgi:hypothetical protein